jgi:hypothetical protein
MKAVLALARKHGVSIDSCYASLVISVCVLVGFGKALDPAVNLMDAGAGWLVCPVRGRAGMGHCHVVVVVVVLHCLHVGVAAMACMQPHTPATDGRACCARCCAVLCVGPAQPRRRCWHTR